MKTTQLRFIDAKTLVTLKRNPQYLTPGQMESLKSSISRDGFCAPILVRPLKRGRYEVISGNHRFMAACELGIKNIPCVIATMSAAAAKRLAVNLNTIHGEPNAELLAPFLAEMDIETLKDVHIDDEMKKELMEFDATLAKLLSELEAPDSVNTNSRQSGKHSICECPTCHKKHYAD